MPDLTASSAVLDAPGSRLAVGAPPSSESPGFRRAARAPGEPVEPAGAAGDVRAAGSTGAGRSSGPAGQLVRTVDGAPLTPDVRVLVVTVATGRAAPAAPISPASLAGSADAAARASWGSRAAPLAPHTLPSETVPEDLAGALSGDLSASQIDDVLALVRACTGYGPSLCSAGDLSSAVVELLENTGAVLLLGRADVLADAPVSACPGGEHLSALALDALAAPDGADRLVAALLSAQHPPRARVVALIGARGGLGASTFLLHLARACAAAGARVAILDADPAGGLGLLIGDGVVPGLHWGDLPVGEAAFRPDRLVPVLPTWLGMPVLTGDGRGGVRFPASVGPALEALSAHHDLVLVDLPRGAELPSGCLCLLVTGLDLRSAVATEALVARARSTRAENVSVALAVRPVGEDVSPDDLEAMTGARVMARIPHDRAVAQRVARGDDPTRGRGGTRRAARAVAGELVGLAGEGSPW